MRTIQGSGLLTAEGERELARAIEAGVLAQQALDEGRYPGSATATELEQVVAGGRRAHEEFFIANLGLVRSAANRWARRTGLAHEEMFQEGCLALAEAIVRWDYARGTRLSTLAWGTIDRALATAALLRCGELDASKHRARASFEIRRTWAEMEAELGRTVSVAEVADRLGRRTASVQTIVGAECPASLPRELVEDVVEATAYRAVPVASSPWWVRKLPDDERTVLCGRFGLGEPSISLAAMARRLGVSRSTVRRIERRGLNRARRLLVPD